MSRHGNSEITKDIPKKKLNKDGIGQLVHIFKYMWPYKAYYALSMVFLFLSTFTALAFPALIGPLLDAGNQTQSSGFLARMLPDLPPLGTLDVIKLLVIILILQGIFSFFKVIITSYVTENAMADIRKDLFSNLISLPVVFFEKNRVGALLSRVTADVTQLQETFSWTLAEFLRQIMTLIVGAVFIAMMSGKLALVMLSTFQIMIIGAIFFGKFIKKMARMTQEELANSSVVVEESLHNISVVKSFTNEIFEKLRYFGSIEKVVGYGVKTGVYRAFFSSFIIYAIFGTVLLVFYLGVKQVEAGTMTSGDLLSFVLFTAYIGASVGGLGDIYSRLQKAVGSTERLREILEETPEVQLNAELKNYGIEGDIAFENVYFSYPTRKDISTLQNLSFDIRSGEKVALVGSSGAGKSTIIQLLMGFYQLDGGAIKIDGKAADQYELRALRNKIGMVPQEVILFGGTIKENILYGRTDASEAEVIAAAKQANAWEFISSFPEGLETIVGERGIKLSGGQKQRVAIARAILKDPVILILDEATSSLDSESEKLVQEALDKLMEGRTSIIIAHRLSTVRDVNQIMVLENGNIVEKGKHSELSTLENGKYRHFLEMQNEDGPQEVLSI